jgi:hypothetical protein
MQPDSIGTEDHLLASTHDLIREAAGFSDERRARIAT